jgi:hypothetical protein
MKDLLLLLGGGALVYWYMCSSKKHNCNCEGDFALKLGNDLKEAGDKTAKYLNEAILQKDGSSTNKPIIGSTGTATGTRSFCQITIGEATFGRLIWVEQGFVIVLVHYTKGTTLLNKLQPHQAG